MIFRENYPIQALPYQLLDACKMIIYFLKPNSPLNKDFTSKQLYKCIVVPEVFRTNALGNTFSNSCAAFKPVQ